MAINCRDGRFLAVAAVLAFVCLLVGFVLIFLSLLSSAWLSLWDRQILAAMNTHGSQVMGF